MTKMLLETQPLQRHDAGMLKKVRRGCVLAVAANDDNSLMKYYVMNREDNLQCVAYQCKQD